MQYVIINELLIWPMYGFRKYLSWKASSLNKKDEFKADAKNKIKDKFLNSFKKSGDDQFEKVTGLNTSVNADESENLA